MTNTIDAQRLADAIDSAWLENAKGGVTMQDIQDELRRLQAEVDGLNVTKRRLESQAYHAEQERDAALEKLRQAQGGEAVAWRDHVEQRIRNWQQRQMNKSGDRLALDDFMGQESIEDLVDWVCDEWASPPLQADACKVPQAFNLSSYINDANINASDMPHTVVEKLQTAIDRTRLSASPATPRQCRYPDCKCPTEDPCLQGLAAPTQVETQGWMPIESAPKDGTKILVYCPRLGVCGPAEWNTREYTKKPKPYWTHWGERIWGTLWIRADQPTHWQPLPPAPQGGE